jgi:hypothetical protein
MLVTRREKKTRDPWNRGYREITVHEAPEFETDRLHEQIQEEVEHDAGASLKGIAVTTALFAALAATAALPAAGTVNEALVLKAQATRLQG